MFAEAKLLEGDSTDWVQSIDHVRVTGHLKRDVSIDSSHNVIHHKLQPCGQWFPGGRWRTLAVMMTYPNQAGSRGTMYSNILFCSDLPHHCHIEPLFLMGYLMWFSVRKVGIRNRFKGRARRQACRKPTRWSCIKGVKSGAWARLAVQLRKWFGGGQLLTDFKK